MAHIGREKLTWLIGKTHYINGNNIGDRVAPEKCKALTPSPMHNARRYQERHGINMETWKDIEGFENYQVSNLGNVRSKNWRNEGITKNLYLKGHNKGYLQVELMNNGIKKCFLVHRLVAEAFIPNPQGFSQINHIDEDKHNNIVENLEWCDGSGNMKAYISIHGSSKPLSRNEKVNQISLDGKLIKEWGSANEIKKELAYHPTSIWECCEGKRKTAYGYKWQYAIGK